MRIRYELTIFLESDAENPCETVRLELEHYEYKDYDLMNEYSLVISDKDAVIDKLMAIIEETKRT